MKWKCAKQSKQKPWNFYKATKTLTHNAHYIRFISFSIRGTAPPLPPPLPLPQGVLQRQVGTTGCGALC
jgi:hypothetical protein